MSKLQQPHRETSRKLADRLTPAAVLTAAVLLALTACGGGEPAGGSDGIAAADAAPVFTDVTAAAGIDHVHEKPALDPKLDHIGPWVSSVGAAVAAGDFDNDGWVDLYVTTSRKGSPNRLYRNLGDGTFTDVAPAAGLAAVNDERGTSMDAAWGDVDNDGWDDLYLLRWGYDSLYRNNGDGTFTDITAERFSRRDGSPGTDWANGDAVLFLDADLDGRLDIYVGNYFREVDLWHLDSTRIMHDDFETAQNGGENFFYRQRPDGTFEEIAGTLGVEDPGWTLAVGSADVDNDGWADLFCADDFGPDRLFLNRGDGTFVDVTETATGLDTKKGMNVDFGDFNNDGWLDIYVTNITTAEYLQEGNALWHNNGPGPDGTVTLTDVSLETGTYDGGWGWAGKFFDYDNDGDLDIVSMNGFISGGEGNFWYDLASWTVTGEDAAEAANWPPIGDRSFSGYERNRLFRNDGLFTFTEQARAAGLVSDRDGRGVAVVDYDNDGDLDLYFANQDQPPNLYRNDSGGHWLLVDLVADPATGVNADAVGARVTLLAGGRQLLRERDGGNGFSSQSDPRLHFGLGDAERVDLLEVRWPDGGRQYLENVAADQILTVEQDPGAYADVGRIDRHVPEARERKIERPLVVEIDPAELDRQLSELEAKIDAAGRIDHSLASTYRHHAATHGAWDRSIAFFTDQLEKRPGDLGLQLELGSAYIDKVPTCGGLAAIVCKGSLARKSLDHFDVVVTEDPDGWAGYYTRGINHLHWPRSLRHSDDAAGDLARAIEIQGPEASAPEHLRVYLGLGDALTKDGRYDEARQAWRRALELFPGDQRVTERLALDDDAALLAYVEDHRSLERPIDTDLSFLEKRRGD